VQQQPRQRPRPTRLPYTTLFRSVLAAQAPEDGIYGEEHGQQRLDAGRVWVLDPIDGTRSFITGSPLWGTLIAAFSGGRVELGMIDRKSTRLNSSHVKISYAVFCL